MIGLMVIPSAVENRAASFGAGRLSGHRPIRVKPSMASAAMQARPGRPQCPADRPGEQPGEQHRVAAGGHIQVRRCAAGEGHAVAFGPHAAFMVTVAAADASEQTTAAKAGAAIQAMYRGAGKDRAALYTGTIGKALRTCASG